MKMKKKQLIGFVGIGLLCLLMLIVTTESAKATVYLTDSTGADLVSGNNYKIMFGWGSTSSKNVYLTGNQFYSNPNESNAGNFQIIRTDQKMGLPIQPQDGFIVKNTSTGQYWNYHSDTTEAYVLLGNSPIPDDHNLTTNNGSTFFATGNRNYKNGDGYNYGLGCGAGYELGYDWNNKIGTVNYYETEIFFKP